ncbi:MAG: hypothetical protein ACLFUI_04615, partial [Halanaerobiales bacterium]
TEEYESSADISDDSTVTGDIAVKTEADTVSAASLNITDEAVFSKSISEDGKWIICTVEDLSFDEELVVEGTFYNKGNSDNDVYRKIAPYEQDQNRNVTERYTITAPKMTIESPNTNFQAGIFEGDIFVEANGFKLTDATVEGNVYFATEEYESSADISDDSTVTGNIEVE